ncbi:metallophosphoesterase, partial [Acidobacteriota bacterium]
MISKIRHLQINFKGLLAKKFILFAVVALLFTPIFVRSYAQSSQWEWEGVDRVVAIGDVHGSYEKLVSLLRGMELVDDQLAWIGEEDHLVFCGDLIDRGPDDRPVMDLIIRLQSEAASQGGCVHVVLGNHDVLNLVRDTRYIHPKGFADFASEEQEKDRNKAWKEFKSIHSRKAITEDKLKAAFDDLYKPGFFARLQAFEAEGQYGSWLLTLPTVIKINNILFVHGGLTPEVAAVGIDGINRRVQESLVKFMNNSKQLERLIKEPATFKEITETAFQITNRAYQGRTDSRQKDAAKAIVELIDSSYLFSTEGPLWYRGNSLEDERFIRIDFKNISEMLKADTLVVAHTPTPKGRITTRNGRTIVRSDVGMAYDRAPFAVVYKEKEWKEFDPWASTYTAPTPENPSGEEWFKIQEQLSDRQLEDYLRKSKIKKVTQRKALQDGRPFGIVELKKDEKELRAIFQATEEKPRKGAETQNARWRTYKHEMAAYLIDRKLKLTMVPVTVIRKITGKSGSLQIMLESVKDWNWVLEHGQEERIRKEYKEAVEKFFVFSALLDVEARASGLVMFLPIEKRIMVADNTKAFSTSPTVQDRFLPELHCPIDPELDLALRELEFKGLEKLV